LLKQPLLHFLLIGFGLFMLFELVSDDRRDGDERVIVVDREALLSFVQFRSKAFEPGVAAARLDAMSQDELQRMVDDYVREEALHREALSLGMDANDYIIKRRLIQKVEFITNSFVDETVQLSEADIEAHYAANADDYYVEPFVTFTHVFFDGSRHALAELENLASDKLNELNEKNVHFSQSGRHGDRFPYFINYVERTPEFVASHFGPEMAQQVFALDPGDNQWHGPYPSSYGLHLVLLSKRVEGVTPVLAEVHDRAADDARREVVRERNDAAIKAIVGTYEVRVTYERPTEEQTELATSAAEGS
jgi:hypothetical protein